MAAAAADAPRALSASALAAAGAIPVSWLDRASGDDGSNVRALILFDVDGTLLETRRAADNSVHKDAFGAALESAWGVRGASVDEIAHSGKTDRWILRLLAAVRGVPDEDVTAARVDAAAAAVTAYCAARADALAASVRALPGVEALLAALTARGAVLGLVTGNLEGVAAQKVRAAGLEKYFSTGGFGSDAEDRADCIRIARLRAAARFPALAAGVPVFHVGDTPYDVDAAVRAGVRGVGVATGHFSAAALREAGAAAAVVETLDFYGAADLFLTAD
jgi:phosphoglycolate phosphatase